MAAALRPTRLAAFLAALLLWATLCAGAAPGAPMSISAVAESPNRVSIRWDPAADNGSPITTYRLIRSQNPSMTLFSVTLVDAMVFDLVDLTPSPGTAYYYGVYATNEDGNSPVAIASPVTPSGPPSVPQALEIFASPPEMMISLAWSESERDHGSAISSYLAEYADDANFATNLVTASNSLDTSATTWELTSGNTYYFRVRALNDDGYSEPALSGPVVLDFVPTAPNGFAVVGSTLTSVDLEWSPPTSDNGYPINHYVLEESTEATFAEPTTLNYGLFLSFTAAIPTGVDRWYRVRAENSNGYSAAAVVGPFRTIGVPESPFDFTASAESPTRVHLRWEEPHNDGGADVNSYVVERAAADDDGDYVTVLDALSLGVIDTGLTPGYSYSYRLKCISAGGTSGYVDAAPVTPSGVPEAPASISVVAISPTELTVDFSAPASDNGDAVTEYRIETDQDEFFSSPVLLAEVSAPAKLANRGLTPGSTHFYRVAASNSNGYGPFLVGNATTPASPPSTATPTTETPTTTTAVPAPSDDPTTTAPPTNPPTTTLPSSTSDPVSTTVSPSSEPPSASAPPYEVIVTVNGVVFHPEGDTVGRSVFNTTEGGAEVAVGISLGTPLAPGETVTILVAPTRLSEAVVVGAPYVTFDGASTNPGTTPVTVIVRGVPDDGATETDDAFELMLTTFATNVEAYLGFAIMIPGTNLNVGLVVVDAILPASVLPLAGGAVTILGSGFGSGAAVCLDQVAVDHDLVSSSDTQVVVAVSARLESSYVNLTVINTLTSAVLNLPAALYFSASPCLDEGTIEDPDQPGECLPCPDGAVCPGGGRVRPTKGHWTPDESSGVVVSCFPAYKCEGNGSCAAGHGDFACSHCEEGYTYIDGDCHECPSATTNMLLVLVDYSHVVFLVWVVLRAPDAVLQRVVLSAVVIQTICLSVGANIGQIPSAVFDFVAVVGSLGGDPTNAGAACHRSTTGHAALFSTLAGNGDQYSIYFFRSILTLVAAYAATAVLISVMILWRRSDPERQAWWRRRFGASLMGGAMISYYHATQVAIRSLICTHVGGDYGWKLRADMTMTCFVGAHWPMVVAAVVILACVTVGLPVGLLLAARRMLAGPRVTAGDNDDDASVMSGGSSMGSDDENPLPPVDEVSGEEGEAGATQASMMVVEDLSLSTIVSDDDEPLHIPTLGHTFSSSRSFSGDLASDQSSANDDKAVAVDGEHAAVSALGVAVGRLERHAWWLLPVWLAAGGVAVVAIELAMGIALVQLSIAFAVGLGLVVLVAIVRPMSDGIQNFLIGVPPALTCVGAAAVSVSVLAPEHDARTWAAATFLLAVTVAAGGAHGLYFFVVRPAQARSLRSNAATSTEAIGLIMAHMRQTSTAPRPAFGSNFPAKGGAKEVGGGGGGGGILGVAVLDISDGSYGSVGLGTSSSQVSARIRSDRFRGRPRSSNGRRARSLSRGSSQTSGRRRSSADGSQSAAGGPVVFGWTDIDDDGIDAMVNAMPQATVVAVDAALGNTLDAIDEELSSDSAVNAALDRIRGAGRATSSPGRGRARRKGKRRR